jgi:enterochelin esterase-like enzyme
VSARSGDGGGGRDLVAAIVTAARSRQHVRVISASRAGTKADGGAATFWVPDPERHLVGVRLHPDRGIPGGMLDFRRSGDSWKLVISQPPVNRMEYLVELRYPGGGSETTTDPGNPWQAAGAFGPKSVLEFPSYTPPGWLAAPTEPGRSRMFDVPVPGLGGAISVRTWCPAGIADDEPLPLLVVHDGPEYDALASLTRYLSAGMTGAWLPRLRAALPTPGPRDRWYSANTRYARALRWAVIPTLTSQPATSLRIGMGGSLGGLAMLHAHCRYPDALGALFLQSGSFFSPRFDSHERGFPYYRRIVRFVADARAGGLPARRIPVTLTCGALEENAENNRLMTGALRAAGYPATLHEVPDLHNYTARRDAFDPYLTRLLQEVCG